MDAAHVTRNLGDLLIGEGDVDPSVSSRNNVIDLIKRKAAVCQGIAHDPMGQPPMLSAGRGDHGGAEFGFIFNDDFCNG